jgi:hypothetical protein
LNGSRLGKAFSANVFNDLFKENRHSPESPESPTSPRQTPENDHRNPSTTPANTSDASIIENLFGILNLQPHGEDYEELAFARRMRKKKKRVIK